MKIAYAVVAGVIFGVTMPLAASASRLKVQVKSRTEAPIATSVVQVFPLAAKPLIFKAIEGSSSAERTVISERGVAAVLDEIPAGAWRILVRAPNHEPESFVLFLRGAAEEDVSVEVSLAPVRLEGELEEVFALTFSGPERHKVPLVRQGDGTWSARVKATHELTYAVGIRTASGRRHFLLPSDTSRVYFMSGANTFVVAAPTEDGVTVVSFDAGDFKAHGTASFQFSNPDSEAARAALFANRLRDGWAEFATDALDGGKGQSTALPRLFQELRKDKSSLLRDLGAVFELRVRNAKGNVSFDRPAPDSLAWSAFPPAYGGGFTMSIGSAGATRRFVSQVAVANSDPIVRAEAHFALARDARERGEPSAVDHHLREISLLADAVPSLAEKARTEFQPKFVSGKKLEPFRLRLTDGSEFDSRQQSRKPVLLVFSAVGCAPCREVENQLAALRRNIPNEELRVVVAKFGVSAQEIQQGVKGQVGVADYAALPDTEESRRTLTRLGVGWFPTVLLLDGDSVVMATDSDLRSGTSLDVSVPHAVSQRRH